MEVRQPRIWSSIAIVAIVGATCSGNSVAPQRSVATGLWGGQHISLDVTSAGATVQFDCAHGSIDEALTLDNSGAFDVSGRYTTEHPGPTREDETDQPRSVRYVGTVNGNSMRLAISAAGGGESLGSFTLEHGKNGVVRKCL